MQIAVFEWISCGGMHAMALDQIPRSLRHEGGQMLSSIASQLQCAGAEVHTIVETRWLTPEVVPLLEGVAVQSFQPGGRAGISASDATIEAWLELANQVDISLVIAPEIDGTLQHIITQFHKFGLTLLNCHGKFLDNACDKWLTITKLTRAGVAHPQTCLASDLAQQTSGPQSWFSTPFKKLPQYVLKSRFGAGCTDLLIGSQETIASCIGDLADPADWIVQPMIEGRAFSCSGLACHGEPIRWLPLTTQLLSPCPKNSQLWTLEYRGGLIVDGDPLSPTDLLEDTLQALCENRNELAGWIGVDLLLQPNGQWLTIEVNPRLTSNFLAHSRHNPELANMLLNIAARLISTADYRRP
jgi:tyramine---L-glutamate ligase